MLTSLPQQIELEERVVHVTRVAKVVKGGRRFRFRAVVVVGDKDGTVGYGVGKGNEVTDAIKKGVEKAKKNLIKVPIIRDTIPHEVVGRMGVSRVLLKPASRGTGVIAGGAVRAVIELSGIKEILTKSLGSNNAQNVVKATIDALQRLRVPEEYFKMRGKEVPRFFMESK